MPGQAGRFMELPRCLPGELPGQLERCSQAVGAAWERLAARRQFLAGLGGVFREESRLCCSNCRGCRGECSAICWNNIDAFTLPYCTLKNWNWPACSGYIGLGQARAAVHALRHPRRMGLGKMRASNIIINSNSWYSYITVQCYYNV